jgi:hypothetical protein
MSERRLVETSRGRLIVRVHEYAPDEGRVEARLFDADGWLADELRWGADSGDSLANRLCECFRLSDGEAEELARVAVEEWLPEWRERDAGESTARVERVSSRLIPALWLVGLLDLLAVVLLLLRAF